MIAKSDSNELTPSRGIALQYIADVHRLTLIHQSLTCSRHSYQDFQHGPAWGNIRSI